MKIFARHALVGRPSESSADELLLEGSWPSHERRLRRWSLDESIDGRFASIDRLAVQTAERAGQTSEDAPQAATFPYINALALRYYLVKLLRVVVFFRDVRPFETGEGVNLHLSATDDEAYVDLFEQFAEARGARLTLHWHEAPQEMNRPRRRPAWRRWAGRVRQWQPPLVRRGREPDAPRVVVCGNPRILDPVCAELVSRGCRVWWLYERFAVRCWWRWRTLGVEQLVCDTGRGSSPAFSDVWTGGEMAVDDIDLARPLERWFIRRAAEVGRYQSSLVERVEAHFRTMRPTALVLDEDATPLKRIAAALARSYGARSTVVQHGAPCGPFGFVPLAADEIAVWGDSARRQLEAWDVAAERIRVAGWPCIKRRHLAIKPAARPAAARAKRFLLLATMPPRDERPDNVEFHLTSANYAEMFDMVCRVLSQIGSATLTVKLHPRDPRGTESLPFKTNGRDEYRPALPLRIIQSRDLGALVAASDCVLSCASTAGIEAALAGAPVIQLLPVGSGNVLPADEWGLIGSARTADELADLVAKALDRGWQKDPQTIDRVLASHGRIAAARIVDGLLRSFNRERVPSGWASADPAIATPGESPAGSCLTMPRPRAPLAAG